MDICPYRKTKIGRSALANYRLGISVLVWLAQPSKLPTASLRVTGLASSGRKSGDGTRGRSSAAAQSSLRRRTPAVHLLRLRCEGSPGPVAAIVVSSLVGCVFRHQAEDSPGGRGLLVQVEILTLGPAVTLRLPRTL